MSLGIYTSGLDLVLVIRVGEQLKAQGKWFLGSYIFTAISYLSHSLCFWFLPDAGGQARIWGITFLLLSFAEVRKAAADHCLALVEHQVQPIVGELDKDEENSDGGAVDAQSHCSGRQSLWRRKEELSHIEISISWISWLHQDRVWFNSSSFSTTNFFWFILQHSLSTLQDLILIYW